jgi:hypothetical protein
MGDAIAVAAGELRSARGRADARKVMVFMTDGDVTRPVNPQTGRPDRDYAAQYARDAAAAAREAGIIVYTIGFGNFAVSASPDVARDATLIRDLASSPEHYFAAPTAADLQSVYREIATDICEVGPARIEVIPKTADGITSVRTP